MDSILEGVAGYIKACDGSVVATAVLVKDSDEITVADSTAIFAGKTVSGSGIPSGTTVLSVSGAIVKLSVPATASGAVSVTFTGAKKFKVIEYSEYVEELIRQNKMPFVDVVGIKTRKVPLAGIDFATAWSEEYDASIIIIQDAKLMKDVMHGANSIWSLWNYVWNMIKIDRTFGGAVQRIADGTIESRLMTMQKDNSIKIVLETNLTLVSDRFI